MIKMCELYLEIVNLINNGLSTTKIAKIIGKSNPTVLKIVRQNDNESVISKLQSNNNYSRAAGFRASSGHTRGKTYEQIYGDKADIMREKRRMWLTTNNIRPSGNTYEEMFEKELASFLKLKRSEWLKGNNIRPEGATYEEMYGEEIAERLRKKRSVWMKENHVYVRGFVSRLSKPQAQLYDIIKETFEDAEIEYPVKVDTGRYIWLDIAIPSKMINVEYDGLYWHNKEEDEKRDNFLRSRGWNVYRIQSFKNLTESELKTEFNNLQLV
jgi:very-short-patch-repair endonuclease